MTTNAFKIHGMDCAEGIAVLKRGIEPFPGVSRLQSALLNAKMTERHDESATNPAALIAAVARTGISS